MKKTWFIHGRLAQFWPHLGWSRTQARR